MGKYMRKAKLTAEVVLMELSQPSLGGVRTRARTLALQNLQNRSSTTNASSSYLELRSRRLEKLVDEVKKAKEDPKQNPRQDARLVPSSVSMGSVGPVPSCFSKKDGEEGLFPGIEASLDEKILEYAGVDRNARESTPSSHTRDSNTMEVSGSTNRPKSVSASTLRRVIPSPQEMDDFFADTERHHQILFMEKYNYDPISDSPLPGRYEWVKI